MKTSVLLALLLTWATGCRHGPPPWRPYKAEYLTLTPIAQRAALVYEGDLETVLGAGAKLIGEMRAKGDKQALIRAPQVGGTHVYLVKSETQTFVVGSTCSANTTYYGAGSSTLAACRNVTRTVSRNHYAVLRLELDAWATLPPLLRPWPLSAPAAPRCSPLPPPERGCKYTHYRGFMKYDEDRVYLQCENEALRDVTDTLPSKACKFGP